MRWWLKIKSIFYTYTAKISILVDLKWSFTFESSSFPFGYTFFLYTSTIFHLLQDFFSFLYSEYIHIWLLMVSFSAVSICYMCLSIQCTPRIIFWIVTQLFFFSHILMVSSIACVIALELYLTQKIISLTPSLNFPNSNLFKNLLNIKKNSFFFSSSHPDSTKYKIIIFSPTTTVIPTEINKYIYILSERQQR